MGCREPKRRTDEGNRREEGMMEPKICGSSTIYRAALCSNRASAQAGLLRQSPSYSQSSSVVLVGKFVYILLGLRPLAQRVHGCMLERKSEREGEKERDHSDSIELLERFAQRRRIVQRKYSGDLERSTAGALSAFISASIFRS